ncbi:hypothetical protein BU24DRAFT_480123 [Aaosphaeria arxii CBS 175.79]|uniref:EF-hand domain-containing protein n=1 Tax=Aaosphaeria arxii CBS 175.79 TaxID=1450172 RepID=A0A6A5XPY0_9PLEO|nr:uncharacterized protein BU24DRAFT_480123 [Aaosphaeria arxii CBS 175.79]KAF2015325.1 hypothetical protein BU24DRAFT_480123 [Aaosphaeria arxii CBS 175.79]
MRRLWGICAAGTMVSTLVARGEIAISSVAIATRAEISCTGCDTCPMRCEKLCRKGCPDIPDDPRKWPWADQQCVVQCYFQCIADKHTPAEGLLGRRGDQDEDHSDEKMFRMVDIEGLGFFNYGQFLQMLGEADTPEASSRFQRFDSDGDGKLSLHEMRLQRS